MQDIVALSGLGAVYLVLMNGATFLAFAWDKRSAVQRKWRIPEAHLLLLALIGGSPAAKLAQRRLRHKTRKQPFGFKLNMLVAVHVLAVGLLVLPDARSAIAGAGRDLLSEILSDDAADPVKTLPRRFGPGS